MPLALKNLKCSLAKEAYGFESCLTFLGKASKPGRIGGHLFCDAVIYMYHSSVHRHASGCVSANVTQRWIMVEWMSLVVQYGGPLRWPTSTILRLYAHCCSSELRFFSAKHFSALPIISRLCRVFFCYAKHFSAMLSVFCSAKHFSSMLITCFLCQAFIFCAENFSALPSIFRPL